MFTHIHALQFEAKPDGPDIAFARRFQEVLGGKWGELTVATQYLLQGWNCRLPGKYKDMLLGIGTEELAHVEMIVTMIDRLTDGAPFERDEANSKEGAAGYGHMNPQHVIVNGGGASYMDSNGVPWSGAYVTASGNLLADFQLNATAEMQGRLQVARLFHMTDDPGVKDLIRFLVTRDHAHQLMWLAAVQELQDDGLDGVPVPEAFPLDEEYPEFANVFINASDGGSASEGSWAGGPTPDGRGEFTYTDTVEVSEDRPVPPPPTDPRMYATPAPDGAGLLAKAKDALT